MRFDAAITLVHGFELPPYAYAGLGMASVDYLTPIEDATRTCLDDALKALEARVPGAKGLFRKGAAWEQILLATEEVGADRVVMGTHGRRGLTRALPGSVAEKVVRLSRVPVLTVRQKATA